MIDVGCLIRTFSPEETQKIGKKLGSLLLPGSFILLEGELGGGKTCFTRGIVSGVDPDCQVFVSSPTFAIMNEYRCSIPVYHFDFYRLHGAGEITELGFEDYFCGEGICIAEWGERTGELTPPDHITVTFRYVTENCRDISFEAEGGRSSAALKKLSSFLQKGGSSPNDSIGDPLFSDS